MSENKKATDVFVYSKLACDNAYTTYKKIRKTGGNDMPRKDRQVLINGGSGVINKSLITPHGVVTRITSEELEYIRKNDPAFKRHEERGFLKVLEKDPTPKDTKKIAGDMPDDKSKQKNPKDLKNEKKKD